MGPWERLEELRRRPERRILGLMSGMSRDGLDLALVRVRRSPALEVQVEAARTVPYGPELWARLAAAPEAAAPELARLDFDLAEAWAAAALEFLAVHGPVDLVGSHGQTVAHHPRAAGRPAATLQLGQAAVLAERLGVPVVSDFRARDVAAGGEGAPLVPRADWLLHARPGAVSGCLNLGSIANVSVLPARAEEILAFDAGPANALIDALARAATGDIDRDGALSAGGAVCDEVLLDLYRRRRHWLAQPPPRSAGYATFSAPLAAELRAAFPALGAADLVRSAVEFSALVVRDALAAFVLPRFGGCSPLRASGGGCRNPTLMAALRAHLAPLGVALEPLPEPWPDAKEAVAFALLADATLCGEPGNVPSATGARHPVVLGTLTP